MEYVYNNAGKLDTETKRMIKEVVDDCEVCKYNGNSKSRQSVVIPRVSDFSKVIWKTVCTLDGICFHQIVKIIGDNRQKWVMIRWSGDASFEIWRVECPTTTILVHPAES